jgi:hypothetical protein
MTPLTLRHLAPDVCCACSEPVGGSPTQQAECRLSVGRSIKLRQPSRLELSHKSCDLRLRELVDPEREALSEQDAGPGVRSAVVVTIDDQAIKECLGECREAVHVRAGANGLFQYPIGHGSPHPASAPRGHARVTPFARSRQQDAVQKRHAAAIVDRRQNVVTVRNPIGFIGIESKGSGRRDRDWNLRPPPCQVDVLASFFPVFSCLIPLVALRRPAKVTPRDAYRVGYGRRF